MLETILLNIRAVEAAVAIVIGLLALWVMWRVGYTRATEKMADKWKGLYEGEKESLLAVRLDFDKCKAEWQKTLDKMKSDMHLAHEAHRQALELNARLLNELDGLKRQMAASSARIDALETELEETVKRQVRAK